jgi:hypothetical protein
MAGVVAWFANSAVITVTGNAGALTVGALKGVTVEPKYELVELYGMEDLRRAGVARHSMKVAVTVKYAKWDAGADTIFNEVIGTDFTGASKNVPAMFQITAAFKSIPATAGETIQSQTFTVSDVVFDGVPINLQENEFMTRDLSGTGKRVTMTNA